ncbi:MAG: hydrogenase expression/formation protein HypE [Gammaproteobacteria bacterium]|jgi:hydrogenase expression/formation protein HypE|nr:hydrogenase expression/formation protein HypE [Gammaproteobacteria bacterium]
MEDRYISLAHGNGGRFMRELIKEVFAAHLANPCLDTRLDAVTLPWDNRQLVMSTDGFTVQPLEFPGGDIGSLAVHGTCNDLAVAGAIPVFLTLNAFIEEGFDLEVLDRLIASLARTAREMEVDVVAGDTKVLPRGQGGGLYLATTGVGRLDPRARLSLDGLQEGDRLLVSGPVGDHGIAVMLAREQFGLSGSLRSDAASVLPFTRILLDLPGLRFMRDPTRGGLVTVCHELCHASGLAVHLNEAAIPVREQVISVCQMLGYDPYYLACEGRVVAVLDESDADQALERWRDLPGGEEAALIGTLKSGKPRVHLETRIGGSRLLEELEDDPLPRIC